MKKIKFFTVLPYCPGSDDPDCCSPPGLSQEEVKSLVQAMENEGWTVEVCDIRDVRIVADFPEAMRLFKEYQYDALPIIITEEGVVAYGIPDARFIIALIKSKLRTHC